MVCNMVPETQSSLWCDSVHKTATDVESQWWEFCSGGHWQSSFSRQGPKGTHPSASLYSVWDSRAMASVTSGQQRWEQSAQSVS